MANVEFDGVRYPLQENQSVLDGLLTAGHALAYSCKSGACGSCMMRAVGSGEPGAEAVPARAQAGLKDSWKAQGYFLPCVCYPEQDLAVATLGADARVAVTIRALDLLSDSVLRVRLGRGSEFDYRAGQYITLFRNDGLARSYSVASLPGEELLELHVRLLPNGRMSQWLAREAGVGTALHVQGPSGECFYMPGREDQPLLLAGTGTGLAPLYGIAKDALRQGHRGPVHLFHGAVNAAGLYLQAELGELAGTFSNFTYTPTLLDSGERIDQTVLARYPKLAGWRAFLCGDPAVVQTCKKKMFLAGASLNDIYADAFLPSVA